VKEKVLGLEDLRMKLVVRQKVTVTKENPGGHGKGLQGVLDQEKWEEEKRRELEDQLVLAEVRGLKAAEKEGTARFLQEKSEKEVIELKKSVRLVEDLRAAKVVKQRKPIICDVQNLNDENKENHWKPFKQLGHVQRDVPSIESPFHCCEVSRQKPDLRHGVLQKPSTSRASFRPMSGLPKSGLNAQTASQSRSIERVPAFSGEIKSLHKGVTIGENKPRKPARQVEQQISARGREQLEDLLGRLGSLNSTEEPSQLSTISERSEGSVGNSRDSVDLVPVRGPTPEEDSAASSISPFPSSRVVSSRRDDEPIGSADVVENPHSIDSVAALVSRIKCQRELLEKQAQLKPQMCGAGHPLLPTIKRDGHQPLPLPQQYKMNTDFVKKVLDFSRSSTLATSSSTSETEVRVNIRLPASSSTLSEPSPILKPQQINPNGPADIKSKPNEKRLKKKKQSQKQNQDDSQLLESEKQMKLRYYVEKLLKMKHEEVENLSTAESNDSKKQVRFHESSWLQEGDTTLYCQPPAFKPQAQQDQDSTMCHQPPATAVIPQEVNKRLREGMLLSERKVEAEVLQSISHTSDILLTHTTVDEVSPGVLQAKYLRTRQVLQQKLSLLENPRPPSPGLSSGPLTPSTLTTLSPSSFPASVSKDREQLTPSSFRETPSLSLFSDLSDSSRGTSTISHIDLSDDNSRV